MKKFLSMVLTVVMVLSMASMAFAAGGSAEITDRVEVSGEYELNNVSSITVGDTVVSPSADLETTLKAIQKAAGQTGLDLSPLDADYATTGFYDLKANGSGPYTFTVTLSDLVYYGVNNKYTTNVYVYHYSESEGKLELVPANSFDVNTHTATFTLNSLSPVAFVAIYETDASIGSSSSSSSSSSASASTTTTTDASKAPNTGAADYTAVLCVVAVVAFGAAAVVTTKSRKRA